MNLKYLLSFALLAAVAVSSIQCFPEPETKSDSVKDVDEEVDDIDVEGWDPWKKVWEKIKKELNHFTDSLKEVIDSARPFSNELVADVKDHVAEVRAFADHAKTNLDVLDKIKNESPLGELQQKMATLVDYSNEMEENVELLEKYPDILKNLSQVNRNGSPHLVDKTLFEILEEIEGFLRPVRVITDKLNQFFAPLTNVVEKVEDFLKKVSNVFDPVNSALAPVNETIYDFQNFLDRFHIEINVYEKFADKIKGPLEKIGRFLSPVRRWLSKISHKALEYVSEVLNPFKLMFTPLEEFLNTIKAIFKPFEIVLEPIETLLKGIKSMLSPVEKGLKKVTSTIDKIKKALDFLKIKNEKSQKVIAVIDTIIADINQTLNPLRRLKNSLDNIIHSLTNILNPATIILDAIDAIKDVIDKIEHPFNILFFEFDLPPPFPDKLGYVSFESAVAANARFYRDNLIVLT